MDEPQRASTGRVRVWDTESWVANSDDRVAAVIASMRAMGQDRTAGIYAGNVFTSEKPRVGGKEYAVAQVWSPGAAVAACQHFIGPARVQGDPVQERPAVGVRLRRLAAARSATSAPGRPTRMTARVVITGDLSASYDKNRTLFRSVALANGGADGTAAEGGKFVLYDFYANPLPPRAGQDQSCR